MTSRKKEWDDRYEFSDWPNDAFARRFPVRGINECWIPLNFKSTHSGKNIDIDYLLSRHATSFEAHYLLEATELKPPTMMHMFRDQNQFQSLKTLKLWVLDGQVPVEIDLAGMARKYPNLEVLHLTGGGINQLTFTPGGLGFQMLKEMILGATSISAFDPTFLTTSNQNSVKVLIDNNRNLDPNSIDWSPLRIRAGDFDIQIDEIDVPL